MSTAQLAPSTAVAATADGSRRRRRLGPERINWWATAFIAGSERLTAAEGKGAVSERVETRSVCVSNPRRNS